VILGLPAGFDDDRLVRLDDQRRAAHPLAGRERLAAEDRRVAPPAPGEEADAPAARGRRGRRRGVDLGGGGGLGLEALKLDGFDDQPLARHREAELRLVSRLEGGFGRREVTPVEGDRQGGVGALVAQVQLAAKLDHVGAEALGPKLGLDLVAQR
jgi:hypothetical protein